jgi:hypothetical protein
MTSREVITWEQAHAWIQEGTIESLGRLGRSEQQLAEYRNAMGKVRLRVLVVAAVIVGKHRPRWQRSNQFLHVLLGPRCGSSTPAWKIT